MITSVEPALPGPARRHGGLRGGPARRTAVLLGLALAAVFLVGALLVHQVPVLVSTVASTVATLATGNPMLAPILTHVTWSTTMLVVLPMIS